MTALMTRTMPSRFEELRTRRASRVVALAERIYGLAIDVDDYSESSRAHQAIDRYHRQLDYAAKYLNLQAKRKEHILVVNLGQSDPADTLLRTLFDNHVVDLPYAYHDQPPGTSVLPLDVLFSLCSCIKSWLDLSGNNVVLLHIRSSPGTGMETLKFVHYCFMAFDGDSEEPDDYISLVSGGSIPGLSGQRVGLAGIGGPSQQRYSKYFLHILLSPTPPEKRETAISIKSIKFEGVNCLRRRKNSRALENSMFRTPFLMVYQRGSEVWKGQCAGGGSTFDFTLDARVTGDIVLGLWLIKDIKMPGESPIVSFAFHTSFMSPGEFDFASKRLDLNKAVFAGDLSMKIVFEDTAVPVTSMEGFSRRGTDIHEMREMWDEQRAQTKRKLSPSDPFSRDAASPEKMLDTKCVGVGGPSPSPWCASDPPEISNSINTKSEASICGICERYMNGDDIDKPSPPGTPEEPCVLDQINDRKGSEMASPPVEDEAPSTPSTTESNLIRVGLTDDDSEVVPTSSDAAHASKGNESLPSKKVASVPLPPPPPSKLRNARVPPAPSLQKAGLNRPLTRTRSFYWTKTPKQSGTIWCELTNNERLPESMSNMLVTMFGVDNQNDNSAAQTAVAAGSKIREKPNSAGLKVVSSGRATNVSIMMSRFKSFEGGVEGLCKAILSGKGLLVEDLKLLSQMAPREDEEKAFKDFEGAKDDLSGAEHILVQMCEVPRLKEKANCWVIMDNWQTNYEKASRIMQVTKMACQQIKESKKLRTVLEAVLTVGNSMNKGTNRGNAGGCRVESLLKLADTKVTSGVKSQAAERSETRQSYAPRCSSPIGSTGIKITSLLDFVALVIVDQEGDCSDTTGFLLDELTALPEADTYMDGTIAELLDEVREGFEAIELEVASAIGCKWPIIDTKDRTQVQELGIKGGGPYVAEESDFILRLYDFLKESVEGRGILRREYSVSVQFLKSAATWLGEPDNVNPMRVIRDLFEFVKLFDNAYSRVATGACMKP